MITACQWDESISQKIASKARFKSLLQKLASKARLGKARLGKARLGKARLGKARLGKARLGKLSWVHYRMSQTAFGNFWGKVFESKRKNVGRTI